jgi:hypothetical protein
MPFKPENSGHTKTGVKKSSNATMKAHDASLNTS